MLRPCDRGAGIHFFFMWLFAINGILYALFTISSGEWRFVVPDRKSLIEAIQVTLKDLHLTKYLPPQTKYNGAQKIAYTSVILMGAGNPITGLAITNQPRRTGSRLCWAATRWRAGSTSS